MIKVRFGVVLLFVIGAFAEESSRSTGPNIVVVVTDDLVWVNCARLLEQVADCAFYLLRAGLE